MEAGTLFSGSHAPQRRATDRMLASVHHHVRAGERFVGKKELHRLVSLSLAHIDRLEKAGDFPPRIRLSPSRVAWLLSDIMTWMDDKVAASRAN